MEINGLASMTISENKAEVGQNILSKTLQKAAEVEHQQEQQTNRQLQMQSSKASTTVAEVSGEGTRIDAYV